MFWQASVVQGVIDVTCTDTLDLDDITAPLNLLLIWNGASLIPRLTPKWKDIACM